MALKSKCDISDCDISSDKCVVRSMNHVALHRSYCIMRDSSSAGLAVNKSHHMNTKTATGDLNNILHIAQNSHSKLDSTRATDGSYTHNTFCYTNSFVHTKSQSNRPICVQLKKVNKLYNSSESQKLLYISKITNPVNILPKYTVLHRREDSLNHIILSRGCKTL